MKPIGTMRPMSLFDAANFQQEAAEQQLPALRKMLTDAGFVQAGDGLLRDIWVKKEEACKA